MLSRLNRGDHVITPARIGPTPVPAVRGIILTVNDFGSRVTYGVQVKEANGEVTVIERPRHRLVYVIPGASL